MLTAEKKKYTIDDYLLLGEGAPFQIINYDLVRSPSPLPEHQIISGRLFSVFSNFLIQSNNNGIILYAPIDVCFNEGNVVQPDLLYISAERKQELVKDRIEGAPDLVIEILSPSNAYYDLRQKKDIYERYGVKEYIIVDPIAFSAESYVLQNDAYQLHRKAEKNGHLESFLLPGLSFELEKIFA